MLFNSVEFLFFLPIVFVIYWLLSKRPIVYQNVFLLIASYVFYGWWDYRFLALIFISSLADFLIGMQLDREVIQSRRNALLILCVTVNIGILGFFKYYGFFVDSFIEVMNAFGLRADVSTLQIVLPVGISFYTFQTMSYTIDVYRREFSATRDPISFFAFVSFFPQLVAGPIERARNLLPQFLKPRQFEPAGASDGLKQALWGLFKKVVIADNLAQHIEPVYARFENFDGLTLIIATFFFAIQIYCDFSGYSDIAIGTARLFGIELRRNFAFPYFSRDIGEFWRRWHISLSTWFRDYVFIPLGGSRGTRLTHIRNILVTFVVSGFWHGANWTFVFWGLLHGLYYLPLLLSKSIKQSSEIVAHGRTIPSVNEFSRIALTFMLVLVSWVFFRAATFSDAIGFLSRVFSGRFIDPAYWHGKYYGHLIFCAVLLLIEWTQREKQHALQFLRLPITLRWTAYALCAWVILIFGNFGEVDFIYFQF